MIVFEIFTFGRRKFSQLLLNAVTCRSFRIWPEQCDVTRMPNYRLHLWRHCCHPYYRNVLWYLVHTAYTTCLVHVGGVNRIGDKSRLSATQNFDTSLSSPEMRWGILKSLDLLPKILFSPPTRQDNLVLSVVWNGRNNANNYFTNQF